MTTLTAPEKSMQEKVQQKGNLGADVIMFSGCKDSQTSADAHLQGQGQVTYQLIDCVESLGVIPNLH